MKRKSRTGCASPRAAALPVRRRPAVDPRLVGRRPRRPLVGRQHGRGAGRRHRTRVGGPPRRSSSSGDGAGEPVQPQGELDLQRPLRRRPVLADQPAHPVQPLGDGVDVHLQRLGRPGGGGPGVEVGLERGHQVGAAPGVVLQHRRRAWRRRTRARPGPSPTSRPKKPELLGAGRVRRSGRARRASRRSGPPPRAPRPPRPGPRAGPGAADGDRARRRRCRAPGAPCSPRRRARGRAGRARRSRRASRPARRGSPPGAPPRPAPARGTAPRRGPPRPRAAGPGRPRAGGPARAAPSGRGRCGPAAPPAVRRAPGSPPRRPSGG